MGGQSHKTMNEPVETQNPNKLNATWNKREPWVVVDPDFKREWLVVQPLQYFLHQDKDTQKWFVVDRDMDLYLQRTEANTRSTCIRRFFKLIKRPVPNGTPLPTIAIMHTFNVDHIN